MYIVWYHDHPLASPNASLRLQPLPAPYSVNGCGRFVGQAAGGHPKAQGQTSAEWKTPWSWAFAAAKRLVKTGVKLAVKNLGTFEFPFLRKEEQQHFWPEISRHCPWRLPRAVSWENFTAALTQALQRRKSFSSAQAASLCSAGVERPRGPKDQKKNRDFERDWNFEREWNFRASHPPRPDFLWGVRDVSTVCILGAL